MQLLVALYELNVRCLYFYAYLTNVHFIYIFFGFDFKTDTKFKINCNFLIMTIKN